MDDLLASFNVVEVTHHENNPHKEHPRFSLYKVKSSGSCQEERRKRVLAARKEQRYDLLTHLRSIDEKEDGDALSDKMEYQEEDGCYKRPRKYKNFLMLSEWLVDVPEDFGSTYLTVPCPVGKRTLVVSGRGMTEAFTKSGYRVNHFPSLLPGGNRHNANSGYAVLDCIWSECNKTFYVLDVMCWLNQPIIECDTEFRFAWLKSRLEEEIPDIDKVSKYNPLRFQRVNYYDSSAETLSKLFSGEEMPFSVKLDGILFYHRETHYTHGPTPLVGWLKAFMLPEILGVPVADEYLLEQPEKYSNLANHIRDAKEMRQKKKENKKEPMQE